MGRSFRKEIMFLFPLRQKVRKAFIVEAVFTDFKALFLECERLVPDEPAASCVRLKRDLTPDLDLSLYLYALRICIA